MDTNHKEINNMENNNKEINNMENNNNYKETDNLSSTPITNAPT